MKKMRKKLTYANVMSSLAVFLVLGGATAVAAGHLGKNSVGTAQLKPGAVTGKKIRSQAITGANIKDGSVSPSDIAPNSITAAQIADGTLSAAPQPDDNNGEFVMTTPLNSAPGVPVPVPAPFYAFGNCSDSFLRDGAGFVVGSNAGGSTFSTGGDAPAQEFFKLLLVEVDLSEPHEGHPTTVKSQEGAFFATASDGTVISVEDVTVSINVGPDRECVFTGKIRKVA